MSELIKQKKQLISFFEKDNHFVKVFTDVFRCSQCGTDYPLIDNKIMCNGQSIIHCPFCSDNLKTNQKMKIWEKEHARKFSI